MKKCLIDVVKIVFLSFFLTFLISCASIVGKSDLGSINSRHVTQKEKKCILRVGVLSSGDGITYLRKFEDNTIARNFDILSFEALLKENSCLSVETRPMIEANIPGILHAQTFIEFWRAKQKKSDEITVYYDFFILLDQKDNSWALLPKGVYYIAHLLTVGIIPYRRSNDTELWLYTSLTEPENGQLIRSKNNVAVWSWSPFIFSSKRLQPLQADEQAIEKGYRENILDLLSRT